MSEERTRIDLVPDPRGGETYELHVRDFKVATLEARHGYVTLNWQVYGPQQWPDAKAALEGLLELSLLADQLTERLEHERSSPRRPAAPDVHRGRARPRRG